MNCPVCDRLMSMSSENQDIRETGKTVRYIDGNGNPCHAPERYVHAILVTYECDGTQGCEAVYQWSSRTKRMTKISGPVGVLA